MRIPKNFPDEYLKKGRISVSTIKGRIRASTEKFFGRVPEKGRISVSTGKLQNSVEYSEQVESVRVARNFRDEYLKRIELVSVPEKGRIRASTEKHSGRAPEKGRINVSTRKW